MKRIMIIGCSGAGKSTLSHRLHTQSGIEIIHLDQYYWKPNWTETPRKEWEKIVHDLSLKSTWIMDGNYGGTMDIRLEKADTIIFLNYSTFKCLWRVIKRTFKYWKRERPDMPKGCKERFSLSFLHYVAMYNFTRRKSILKKLNTFKTSKNIAILKNDKEVNFFLQNIESQLD